MEVTVQRDRFAKALGAVSRIAATAKTTLPVLSNVLIRAEKDKLYLTTTNLELAIVEYVNAKVKTVGTITVPARLLAEFVQNLSKGSEVKIKVENNKMTVSEGKNRSTINGIVADEFPELPEIDEKKATTYKVSAVEFKDNISKVAVCASGDLARPILTGVFFNTFEGALYIASTDGYRLAEKRFIDDVKNEIKVVVPAVALQEVVRSLTDEDEEIEILFSETQAKFRIGEVEVISKIIDGSFPDYRQLIPKSSEVNLLVDKDELVRTVKLAALFAREVGGSIILETKKESSSLSVRAVASEIGENDSEIMVEVDGDGKITLNSKFLLDGLNVISDEKVRFGFSDKLAPAVIRGEKSQEYIHIIMPLKS
jgi:DNA polymerase-3 subunit beta